MYNVAIEKPTHELELAAVEFEQAARHLRAAVEAKRSDEALEELQAAQDVAKEASIKVSREMHGARHWERP